MPACEIATSKVLNQQKSQLFPAPEGDASGLPQAFTHGPFAAGADVGVSVVDCSTWKQSCSYAREQIVDKVFAKLAKHGYAVLDRLFDPALIKSLHTEWLERRECLSQEGCLRYPLREGSVSMVPPCEEKWADEKIMHHDLVLEVIARYVRNRGGTTESEKEDNFYKWVNSGCRLEGFFETVAEKAKAGLGLVAVNEKAPTSAAQPLSRGIGLPGPCASLSVHIPLSSANGRLANGPLGLCPGTHKLKKADVEIVANIPVGSIVIYDSFLQHRELQNETSEWRHALTMTFQVPGITMGAGDHGGRRTFGMQRLIQMHGKGAQLHMEHFQKMVNPTVTHRQERRDARKALQTLSRVVKNEDVLENVFEFWGKFDMGMLYN